MKQKTKYSNVRNGGVYVIDYQAQNGAHVTAIAHDDKSDILTLRKVGGPNNAPDLIVTSQFDFEENFRESTLLTDPAPKAEPSTRYKDE